MNHPQPGTGSLKLISAFREELFRWNRQINLVSRQETKDRLEGLFDQCIGGVNVISDVVASLWEESGSDLYYFDLGSGGGLPGVIWHILLSERTGPGGPLVGGSVKSWMVEPREKRAWFLNRLNRVPKMPALSVVHGRWGEGLSPDIDFASQGGVPTVAVISLKALHLDDVQVLEGLLWASADLPECLRVIIVRYYPPLQDFDADLVESLKIQSKGGVHKIGGSSCYGLGGEVVPLVQPGEGLASLVLASYDVRVSS